MKIDIEKMEKFRLIFIMSVLLVFTIVFKNVVLFDGNNANANVDEQVNYKASLVDIVNTEEEPDIVLQKTSLDEEDVFFDNTGPEESGDAIEEAPIEKEYETAISYTFASDANPDFLPIRNHYVKDLSVVANAAIIMTKDGDILFEKEIDKKMPIASLTKVVNAMVVMENLDPYEILTISKDVIDSTEGKAGRFVAGEKMAVKDLLKVMLVLSSNDAAVAFEDKFKEKDMDLVDLMNKKIKEDLGLKSTHFSNPVGFDDDENYSTAHDFALIMANSLENEDLWKILSIKEEFLKASDPSSYDRNLKTTNKLMFKDVQGLIGGKTGSTSGAGGCLAVAFSVDGENGREGADIISVVLGATDNQARFDETENIINWMNDAYIF